MLHSNQPLVTIAIPTYNRAASFLPECLASARSQSYASFEIFVSDNASADATSELVQGLNDPRIRYHRHPENVGSNPELELLVEQARGEYFLMLQDDDVLNRDFLECCVSALGSARPGFVRSGTHHRSARAPRARITQLTERSALRRSGRCLDRRAHRAVPVQHAVPEPTPFEPSAFTRATICGTT